MIRNKNTSIIIKKKITFNKFEQRDLISENGNNQDGYNDNNDDIINNIPF